MITFKRRYLVAASVAILVAAMLACNLRRRATIPDPVTLTPIIDPAVSADATTSAAAPADASPPAEAATPTADLPASTATPESTTTSTRKDEDFGSYLLTTFTETIRYPVTGSTAEELDAGMALNGPRDEASGTSWFALTVPLFDWDWGCACNDGGCQAEGVAISLFLTYSLPAWHYDEAPPDLIVQWTAFEQALTTHEEGHGALAHACAMSLGERVAAVSGAESCEAVDQRGLAEINAALAQCRAEQRSYEDTTYHGTNDGVVWPP